MFEFRQTMFEFRQTIVEIRPKTLFRASTETQTIFGNKNSGSASLWHAIPYLLGGAKGPPVLTHAALSALRRGSPIASICIEVYIYTNMQQIYTPICARGLQHDEKASSLNTQRIKQFGILSTVSGRMCHRHLGKHVFPVSGRMCQ